MILNILKPRNVFYMQLYIKIYLFDGRGSTNEVSNNDDNYNNSINNINKELNLPFIMKELVDKIKNLKGNKSPG